jgi:hypothetical protein
MKIASVVVLMAIALVVGNTMNRTCKSGYHGWCAPMSAFTKNRPPA